MEMTEVPCQTSILGQKKQFAFLTCRTGIQWHSIHTTISVPTAHTLTDLDSGIPENLYHRTISRASHPIIASTYDIGSVSSALKVSTHYRYPKLRG